MTIREIIEERGRLVKQSRDIITTAASEKRELTGEEKERYDVLESEINRLGAVKELEERQIKLEEAELRDEQETRRKEDAVRRQKMLGQTDDEVMENRNKAFVKWLRFGANGLNNEERAVLGGMQSSLPPEMRALSSGTDATGGYTVPMGFQAELDKAMVAYGGMREVARVLPTSSGQDLEWPTVDDTSNAGAILAENTQVTAQDIAFSAVTFNAYMYTSKMVLVSLQLLQDSGINIEAELGSMLGERIARITNTHFTTGDASGKPNGVATAATDSSIALGDPIYIEKLLDLIHVLDPAYRRNARFMFNDATFKILRNVRSWDGTDLAPEFAWQMGLRAGEPDTILGYPYTINQDVADHATTARSVLFGDFSKYIIRDVTGAQVMRLTERYADYLQVGFLAFSRHDGDLINAAAIVHASHT